MRELAAEAPDDGGGDAARGRHRDLLAEHGAHGQLGAVGRARHAHAGGAADERREERVAGEQTIHGHRIGVEVEQRAATTHGDAEIAQVLEAQSGFDVVGARRKRHDGVPVRQPQAAMQAAVAHFLEPGHGARGEEVEQPCFIERLAAREPQHDEPRLGGRYTPRAGAPPQLARRPGEDGPDRVVELPQAGEPGGEGDLPEGQVGRLDEDPCRLRALRARETERSRAELVAQQAPELARAVGEPPRQPVHAFAVDDAVGDQAHGAPRHVGALVPLGRAGRSIGAAAQAGAVAGGLRRRRRRVEAHVLASRHHGRAARPAVDARGRHCDEEPPVEARVATAHRLVACVRVGRRHGTSVPGEASLTSGKRP